MESFGVLGVLWSLTKSFGNRMEQKIIDFSWFVYRLILLALFSPLYSQVVVEYYKREYPLLDIDGSELCIVA
jgi:surface polysaccharide O-acyltransferase-like enzyme